MVSPISTSLTSLIFFIGAFPVHSSPALLASWNIVGGVLDVTNDFRNKIFATADRNYVTIPQYYSQHFWQC